MWRDATILTDEDGEPFFGVWRRDDLHIRAAAHATGTPSKLDLRDREIRDRAMEGETVETIAAAMRLGERTVRKVLG